MSAPIRLRVATLNVWGLAEGLSRHLGARMEAIGRALPTLELDVLALQESWTEEGRAVLVAGARDAGLEHVWHRPEAFGGSGLVLCSRQPLQKVRFVRFLLNGHPERIDHADYFGGKGAVIATLDTAAGAVDVLNTHLVARYRGGPRDGYHGHRAGQLVQIASALQASARPVVALGDFNLTEASVEHEILVGLTGLRDVAIELDRRQDTIEAPHPYRSLDHRERIDYALVRDGESLGIEPRSVDRIFDAGLDFGGEPGAYSDHAGLLGELELRSRDEPEPRDRTDARVEFERARALAHDALRFGEERGRSRSLGLIGTAITAGAGATALAWKTRSTRRQLLRALAGGGAALLGAGGLGAAGLAVEARGRVPAAYAELRAQLDALEAPRPTDGGAQRSVDGAPHRR